MRKRRCRCLAWLGARLPRGAIEDQRDARRTRIRCRSLASRCLAGTGNAYDARRRKIFSRARRAAEHGVRDEAPEADSMPKGGANQEAGGAPCEFAQDTAARSASRSCGMRAVVGCSRAVRRATSFGNACWAVVDCQSVHGQISYPNRDAARDAIRVQLAVVRTGLQGRSRASRWRSRRYPQFMGVYSLCGGLHWGHRSGVLPLFGRAWSLE